MRVKFEYVYAQSYQDHKIFDLIDFKANKVEPIVNDIEKNYLSYLSLTNGVLSFKYKEDEYTLEDEKFLGKSIDSIEVELHDDWNSYDELRETDISSGIIFETSHDLTLEESESLQDCAESKNNCYYVDGYDFYIDVIVNLK